MLIGEAICLGPLLREDAAQVFNWRNNLAIARANGPFRPIDEASFNAWFNVGGDPARVIFAVRAKPDLRLLGFVQLFDIQASPRSAELGIMIGSEADRNRGHGQEAVRLALGYAWQDLNLQRVFLRVIGDNPGAVRAYAKAGFEVEGVLRRAAYVDGDYRDVTLMACLRDL